MYVCGPTVYGDPHLGHARSAISFDILFRYLKYLGYRVRYVRNITDVGHLENDSDEGEDKIAKKARLEQLEPMEVAQYYTNRYHAFLDQLNLLKPSIEPRASGHIPQQLAMITEILKKGFAYEANGSVYFDVEAYRKHYPYGKLSGRENLEELVQGYRDLDGQSEKRSPHDFALWKKAAPEHIMRWQSPWGEGFPGWHLECSAMSTQYLGEQFDIHGGGLDLMFPHHEAEIAQANACQHATSRAPGNEARYWLHNNMITIHGQKMGKSLGNFITLEEFFLGCHEMLTQAYSPMTIRFFMLQGHYRSTLDFSNEALQAAEKAFKRLMHGLEALKRVKPSVASTVRVSEIKDKLQAAMNDDMNTAVALAELFEAVRTVHALEQQQVKINAEDLGLLSALLHAFVHDVLGLEAETDNDNQFMDGAMKILIEMRQQARAERNFVMADGIRDKLKEKGILLHDGAEGTAWSVL